MSCSFLPIPKFLSVPEGHCAVLERFGKFDKVLYPGFHWINPLTSSLKSLQDWTWVRKESFSNSRFPLTSELSSFSRSSEAERIFDDFFKKESHVTFSSEQAKVSSWFSKKEQKEWTCAKPGNLMELTEQQWVTNPCSVYTKDRVEVQTRMTLHFRITDPYKAAYAIDVLPHSIHNECHAAIRSEVGKYEFGPHWFSNKAKFFEIQEELGDAICRNLQGRVENWGVEILRADLGPFVYNKSNVEEIKRARSGWLFLPIITLVASAFFLKEFNKLQLKQV